MDLFSALADPNRRNILEMLSLKGELSASEIYDKFSVSPPAISQHLKVLREVKLVRMEKRAQQHIYQLNPNKIHELDSWVQKLTKMWNDRFSRLDKLLAEDKRKLDKK